MKFRRYLSVIVVVLVCMAAVVTVRQVSTASGDSVCSDALTQFGTTADIGPWVGDLQHDVDLLDQMGADAHVLVTGSDQSPSQVIQTTGAGCSSWHDASGQLKPKLLVYVFSQTQLQMQVFPGNYWAGIYACQPGFRQSWSLSNEETGGLPQGQSISTDVSGSVAELSGTSPCPN